MTDEGHDCNVLAEALDLTHLRVSLPVVELALSMQHQGAADSNEWAHGVVSVITASGGFSSLAMRGCVSTKAPDAEGGVMAACEPTKPAKNSGC